MRLSKAAIESGKIKIPDSVRYIPDRDLPEKIIQFGEGNFLRAFIDWIFARLADDKLFDGSVVVVQPIEQGRVQVLNEQGGLSTLIMRGYKGETPVEEIEIIKGISRGLNPYLQWEEILRCAENPDIEYVLSNTTEAGISFDPRDQWDLEPPCSFPGKITAYLYRRYKFFDGAAAKGLIFLPCELNDRNGGLLKSTVLRLASYWKMEPAFINWIEENNHFLNTLVDRTVTGYPKDEAQQLEDRLGYNDGLLNVCEMFHLWVIEDPLGLTENLRFEKAGLNVKRVMDITPYRSRKVRILNGGHTSSVPAAFQYGLNTVQEMMDHDILGQYVRKVIYGEIIPSLEGGRDELTGFAGEVARRFENPLIKHYLSSILLNSISKYAARVIDSITAYCERYQKAPALLSFSFAALIALYRAGEIDGNTIVFEHCGELAAIQDDPQSLAFFNRLWMDFAEGETDIAALTHTVLANKSLWGRDMTACCDLLETVSGDLADIVRLGPADAINRIVNSSAAC